jgi:hypothetical protein
MKSHSKNGDGIPDASLDKKPLTVVCKLKIKI